MIASAGATLGPSTVQFRLALGGAVLIAAAIDAARLRDPALNRAFLKGLRALVSKREAVGVASSTWYLAGAFLAALLPPACFTPAVLVLAISDPCASVAGRLWGRAGRSSWVGSSAFLVSAFLALLPFREPWTALAVALLAAAAEALPLPWDDNVTIPVVAAASLWALDGLLS